ncbi:MAG: hypothetical protein MJZ81_07800 [Bacteroidales bacterium]|nr:hypothetical protein [Bacteroidales bacterium]
MKPLELKPRRKTGRPTKPKPITKEQRVKVNTCAECGAKFTIPPTYLDWAWRYYDSRVIFCSYKCMRSYDAKRKAKERAAIHADDARIARNKKNYLERKKKASSAATADKPLDTRYLYLA